MLFCIGFATALVTTFLLILTAYSDTNSPQDLLTRSELIFGGKHLESFNAVSFAKPLKRVYSPSYVLLDRRPLSLHNDSVLAISKSRIIPLRKRKRHNNNIIHRELVFKSWRKGIVTEMSPSLHQNCSELMAGNSSEIVRVSQLVNHTNATSSLARLSNCTQVVHEFNDQFYISEKEREFPIAFILVVHTNAEQILRFLKAIYRSNNIYCIHPDLKSGQEFLRMFKLVSSCLPNVLVSSHVNMVNYNNDKSILEAQLSCMGELEAYKYRKWKYVINLCGRELPLKTNRYIVDALTELNGTSIVRSFPIDAYTLKTRFTKLTKRIASRAECTEEDAECIEQNDGFLHGNGIKLYKSMAYNALSLDFVRYILNDNNMKLLTIWMLTHCRSPEEHFYATAYMTRGALGGFHAQRSPNLPQISKTLWKHDKTSHYYTDGEECSGRSVHQVCVLSTPDLPFINKTMGARPWFFNKYFMDEDHVVMDCVEEELVRANRKEFDRDHHIFHHHHYPHHHRNLL